MIILNFNYITVHCQFEDGSISGGLDKSVGVTSDEQECARMVRKLKPYAIGATLYGGHSCYAEYGREVSNTNFARYCFFGNIIQ